MIRMSYKPRSCVPELEMGNEQMGDGTTEDNSMGRPCDFRKGDSSRGEGVANAFVSRTHKKNCLVQDVDVGEHEADGATIV